MEKKNKSIKVRFGLADLLTEKRITHRKAAEMTGLSKTGITVLAGQPDQVKIATIEKLCNGLQVKPCELFVVEEA